MGKTFLDKFSLLHYGTGFVASYNGIRLLHLMILHMTFEFVENTDAGIKFIQDNLPWWPGGKEYPDAFINIVGDNVSAFVGWICAAGLSGKKIRLY